MTLHIKKIDQLDEAQARKMFAWETDPANVFCSGPCKGPDDPTPYQTWKELQSRRNASTAHRYGIFDGGEFVGEFNFVFNHPALLKKDPLSAWVAIGIGDSRYRRKGAGTAAMTTIEEQVRLLGGQRIEFGVFAFNEPAIKFYEKLGYERFAEIPNFTWWGGKWWSVFRYEKLLV